MRLRLLPSRPQHVMMVGGVEPAVLEAFGGERPADQDQRRPRDAETLDLAADRGERAADDALVGPGRAMHHDHRAVGAAGRRELAQDAREVLIERWIASVAPVAAKAVSVSRSGIGEARTAVRVNTSDCAIPGSVSSWPSAAAAAAKAGMPGVTA